jgi:hypothetical protein
MKKIRNISLAFLLSTFCIISCSDADEKLVVDNTGEEKSVTSLFVRLTDAPGDYQQVNINVMQVRVQKTDSLWYDLTTNSGYYDLLTLQNGVDTTIVNDTLSKGTQITGLRLVLGDSNTVMVDSVMYPLQVPSGSTSGFKIKFSDTLSADSLNILLDFDAEKSVLKKGQKDEYLLKPVIKVK